MARTTVRSRARHLASAIGVEERLRTLWNLAGPPGARRNARDMRHLSLLLGFTLSTDSNCVDVGCNNGAVLREMTRVAPAGRHIAFEPLPHLHNHLVRSFPGVDVRRAALSNRTGEASFVHVVNRPGYSGFKRQAEVGKEPTETIVVELQTIDTTLPEGYVPTLIKIDVEGSERLVIEGGLTTIATHQPIVVFEYGKSGMEHYGTHPGDIFDLLCGQAKLRMFDLDANGPFTSGQFAKLVTEGRRWNFVARA